MAEHLLIVESPAKAKTIKKYLGADYQILASYGHVRDLLAKEGAVDPNNDFAMHYAVIERNAKHVKAIKEAIKKSSSLLLATDPDREGEAISYHLCEILKKARLLKDKEVKRVVFHEVTQQAILQAIEQARELSMDLVNAQQTRRALDYLVGFNLSPLLWKKVRPKLSAGRVQSPALRLIVEREAEIEKFVPKEYWTIEAEVLKEGQQFSAKLFEYLKEKVKQFSITNEQAAQKAVADLKAKANGVLEVIQLEKKQRKRNPAAPFTTSTLQQEASRKLGFGAQRTMRVAQQLYEGIDFGNGPSGLITYMRTDSYHLSQGAIEELREEIEARYGKSSLPNQARIFKTKSKNAQEAHEAIRPTSAGIHPDQIKAHLSSDQFRLYELIYKRTLACQMVHATIDTVSVDLSSHEGDVFRATGSTIATPGFLKVYEEGKDDVKKDLKSEKMLPPLQKGDKLEVKDIHGDQHFTEPPPRFSEATLVKTLEEYGIGRPSTYATIISTLVNREYVTLDKKRFYPTDVGVVVNRFLTTYFPTYVDYGFTASLEDDLDAISRGEKEWKPLLETFWKPFHDKVLETDKNVKRKDVTHEELDEKCPQCESPLSIRLGRRGRFIGCTKYPDCDYTRSLNADSQESSAPEEVEGRVCPECQSALLIKEGRYGKFIGCSGYPKCRFIEPLEKPKDTGVQCPECHQANILERKSRNGKVFFSCQRYPDCQYALWNRPLAQSCPKCNWPITSVKVTKKRGQERVCPQKSCKFIEPYEGPIE